MRKGPTAGWQGLSQSFLDAAMSTCHPHTKADLTPQPDPPASLRGREPSKELAYFPEPKEGNLASSRPTFQSLRIRTVSIILPLGMLEKPKGVLSSYPFSTLCAPHWGNEGVRWSGSRPHPLLSVTVSPPHPCPGSLG